MLIVCKWLLKLYPASFRSSVGESMMQTVRDSLADGRASDKLRLVGSLISGAAAENIKALGEANMVEKIFSRTRLTVLGFLLIVPGAVMLSLLLLGVEPPLGPLEHLVGGNDELSKWIGTFIVLGTIVILPMVGVLIATRGESSSPAMSILSASAISLLLIVPFMLLQLVYGQRTYSSFPFALFGILWFLPTVAIFIVLPVVSHYRSAEQGAFARPLTLTLRLVAFIPIAIMWFGLVNDQMRCFLGVPNCD